LLRYDSMSMISKKLWTAVRRFGTEGHTLTAESTNNRVTECCEVDELLALRAIDRRSIRLHAAQQRNGGQGTGEPLASMSTLDVRLHHEFASQVVAYGWGDGAQSVARHCIASLLDSGRTSATSAQLRRYLYCVVVLGAAAVVAWAAAADWSLDRLPLLVLLAFASMTSAAVVARSIGRSARFNRWAGMREGARIDDLSRAGRRERRLNHRDDVRAGAVGAGFTLAIAAVTWLAGFIHFGH
jgi:hypothetical protein